MDEKIPVRSKRHLETEGMLIGRIVAYIVKPLHKETGVHNHITLDISALAAPVVGWLPFLRFTKARGGSVRLELPYTWTR